MNSFIRHTKITLPTNIKKIGAIKEKLISHEREKLRRTIFESFCDCPTKEMLHIVYGFKGETNEFRMA
jgi:hypothetical protein